MHTRSTKWLLLTLPITVGVLVLLSYSPGLHGGFLFDDYANMPALGAQGPVTHWSTFWRYITSGTADPTGRPLAMLSFLLDARNWPANPYPFKRTNLILHLLNGILLYGLLSKLGVLLAIDVKRARMAALLGSTLWLLHPLFVSTTLYIVQREAMLVATCVLAGLLLWLHGRQRLSDGKLKTGTVLSVLGLGGFTLLGTLAKANGSLLPLYALLIEIIVLMPRQPIPAIAPRRAHRAMIILFGAIPVAAVLGYVLWTGIHGLLTGGPVGIRSWSIGQRLLTEPRVLIDYLKLLWLPQPFSSGLFNDQYVASTGWLHPATTLPAIIAVAALILCACWQRHRHPALALAVLFYFAGQLLESSSIPLELYFEHRNYVPALLMFWPLGLWLTETRQLRWIKTALAFALPLTLASMTHARSEVWGNVQEQGLIWARINPDSPRAQANAAGIEMSNGYPQAAIRRLEPLLTAEPEQAQLAFNLIDARCMTGSINTDDIKAALKAMRSTANTGTLFVRWFDQVLPMVTAGDCRGLSRAELNQLIDAGLMNPRLSAAGPQQDLVYLRGRIALTENRPDVALADFMQALNLLVRPSFALKAAATLGASGYPAQGLLLLDHYHQVKPDSSPSRFSMSRLHAWVLQQQHYWPHELSRLRATLQAQIPLTPATHDR